MPSAYIRQASLVPGMTKYCEQLFTRYHLEPYQDRNRPAVFYGCYRQEHFKLIRKHRSLAVVVWLGTDAMHIDRFGFFHREKHSNVRHVAIGPFIERDLRRLRIPYKRVNISAVDMEGFQVRPLGDAVFTMIRNNRPDFYGRQVVRKVRARLPDVEFIVRDGTASRAQMIEDYTRSLIGLRATRHDGAPKIVEEMALMGRRSIYKGDYPAAIGYGTVDDIVRAIRQEQSKVGESHPEVARDMMNYYELGRSWLKSNYWGWEG